MAHAVTLPTLKNTDGTFSIVKTQNERAAVVVTAVERPKAMSVAESLRAITSHGQAGRALWAACVSLTAAAFSNVDAQGEGAALYVAHDGEGKPIAGTISTMDKKGAAKALRAAWAGLSDAAPAALKSENSSTRVYLGMLAEACRHRLFWDADTLPTHGEVKEFLAEFKESESASDYLKRAAKGYAKHNGSRIPPGTGDAEEVRALLLACAQSLGYALADGMPSASDLAERALDAEYAATGRGVARASEEA
jgi:hypothetical protein